MPSASHWLLMAEAAFKAGQGDSPVTAADTGLLQAMKVQLAAMKASLDVATRSASSQVADNTARAVARCPDGRRRRASDQVSGVLGSNVTHWVPVSSARRSMMKSRRTFTYRQSGSWLVVRAPQTRIPLPVKARNEFTPSAFNCPM